VVGSPWNHFPLQNSLFGVVAEDGVRGKQKERKEGRKKETWESKPPGGDE